MTAVPTSTPRARHGMVCSVDHLASSAGVAILRDGGTAADAAIATNAVLAVTTQHMCGMGGDLFALVHHTDGEPPSCLNASGRAGSAASAEALRAEGHAQVPTDGDIRAVTVPGCVDGWLALHVRHGALPLADVLEPARHYAETGFVAAPLLAATVPLIVDVDGAEDYRRSTVKTGTVIRRPGVARTLAAIAGGGRDAFYHGEFGNGLLRLGDGLFHPDDLTRSNADWVQPIGIDGWGHRIWTVPPNSQGYLILAALRMLEHLGVTAGAAPDPDSAAWAHALVEAARLAGHDRVEVLHEEADPAVLLNDDALRVRASRFDPDSRADVGHVAREGDTSSLCAVDESGMAVSLIQSNARGWGVGLTVPEVGIFLHNRGQGFSLEPGHPAEYGPGRRPPHTLAPALVQRMDGSIRAVLGTMGGDTQPQIVLQLLARMLLHGESPTTAVHAPRWRLGAGGFRTWDDGGPPSVGLEGNAPTDWRPGLERRGHEIVVDQPWNSGYGHAQLIECSEDGVLAGAHDPRSLSGGTAAW